MHIFWPISVGFLLFFTTALGDLMISCDIDILSLGQDDPHDNHDSNFIQERGHNERKVSTLKLNVFSFQNSNEHDNLLNNFN